MLEQILNIKLALAISHVPVERRLGPDEPKINIIQVHQITAGHAFTEKLIPLLRARKPFVGDGQAFGKPMGDLEMGLLEGEPLEVVGFAPLGDPMEIRLRDYRLSLRRSEAACISVQLVSGE